MDHASLTRSYIADVRRAISGLKIYPRVAEGYEFDHIGLGLLSKAFRLCEACLTLFEVQHFDEAYGLSRSLSECAATLRYLTMKPDERDARTRQYLDYFQTEKVYWLHQARSYCESSQSLEEMEQYARDRKLEASGLHPKQAVKHWSGLSGFLWKVTESEHPIDSSSNTQERRKRDYGVDYHQTSQYVHCSIWSLLNYCPDTKHPYSADCRTERYDLNAQLVLVMIGNYLHICCGYALFGLGIDRPSHLDQLAVSFMNDLEPALQSEAERLIRKFG